MAVKLFPDGDTFPPFFYAGVRGSQTSTKFFSQAAKLCYDGLVDEY